MSEIDSDAGRSAPGPDEANRNLHSDSAERGQAEEKVRHLNSLLRAIRDANQLIAREKDRTHLLRGICESLRQTPSYHGTWIALLDESHKLTMAAEAGYGDDFSPLADRMKRGQWSCCAERAMRP